MKIEKLKANTRTECESFDEHRRQNKKAEIRILKYLKIFFTLEFSDRLFWHFEIFEFLKRCLLAFGS